MYAKQPKKLIIMNILDILKRYTDENHRLSQKEIQDILANEYDMKVDRKAIKRNLMNLIEFGYEFKPTYVDSPQLNEGYENAHITNALTQEDMHGFWDNYMESMNLMISVLIFFSCILSVVVLYNLGLLTFTERERDNATLKVLGFGTNKILNTNIVQNVLYSIIGVILGVPLGLSFTYFMLNFAGDEFDMMISVSPRTLIISSAITLGVSILVSFLFRRKINKLNMVEALKGVE